MHTDTITFWNTGVPLIILGVLGWVLPRMLVADDTRSHWSVCIAVLCAAILLVAASAAVLVAFDFGSYVHALDMGGAILVAEIALINAALFAVAWVPMLLLSWFNMAQRVEHWRGRDLSMEKDV
ncbi:hypothetical protein [uncultured Tateyamaria sp.]|uniref:hypothetical protein n=1 Tax=Tateyamaria sp. 1078 TaxID=3417464 RepID=UPI002621FE9C|nr:hypothetical protein [uncultured Tateyamaria sp.]